MQKDLVTKLTATLLLIGSSIGANASLLYSEDFEDFPASTPGSTGDPGRAFDTYGWTGFNHFGTDYGVHSDASQTLNEIDLGGDWRGFSGFGSGTSTIWYETDIVDFDQADYLSDLQVSLLHRENSAAQRYRVAFKIGGSWFLQDNSFVAGATTATTDIVAVNTVDFAAFTAPTGAFTPPALDLAGSASLPAGTITDFGILMGNKSGTNNAFRWDDVQITATAAIPEPSSIALLGIGTLVLLLRRRLS